MRDGLRFGLTCIPLPKGAWRIGSDVNKFRKHLEDAVLAARGAVTAVDAATINRAARWEALARCAARWLAREGDDMQPETRRSFLLDIARGTTERDRAVADLALEQKHLASLWSLANGHNEA
jgi:hypothetical protein